MPDNGTQINQMSRLLIVIEQAFAGAIEEQYGHLLWVCWSHQRIGCQMGVVLCGNALLYARRQQKTVPLTAAGVHLPHLYNYAESVEGLLADGGTIYVLQKDLSQFQLVAEDLYEAVNIINLPELATLVTQYEAVWYW